MELQTHSMKAGVGRAAPVALALFLGAQVASAQPQPAPQPQPVPTQAQTQNNAPPPPPAPAPQTTPAPPPPGQVAPPPAQWVVSAANGRWVYTTDYGWIWVPAGASARISDGVPYAYLYTPTYGWTWYVSPWGPGRYHFGGWVRHAWHPAGWHGAWVATPRVFVRLGGNPHYRWH
jgi:hypothetical protein